MPIPKLHIDGHLWGKVISDLHMKGNLERESGAFLIGPRERRVITHFICYDELDPAAFETGIIVFSRAGYVKLWDFCEGHGLKVWADVHTHPRAWTGQSDLDKAHPMIAQHGHIAFIVPNYASGAVNSLDGVGIYEYQGNRKWKKLNMRSININEGD
jgi:proteasome lid subunit RPN8/RPN11